MKLLIATGVYPPEVGGPATYTKLLEERLPQLGFEVSVLPFSRVRALPKVVRHVAYFWKCLRMARGVDLVYAQDTVSVGLPALLAATFSGKKFLVRVPGDYAWEQARQRFGVRDELDLFQKHTYGVRVEFLRAIQKFVVHHASAVVVPSAYMKSLVGTWVDQRSIHTIYSSIDLTAAHQLPIERPEGFLVVSSGRPVPWKNFDGIRRVVEREKNWHFFLVRDMSRAQALGWVKAADAFVLNSTYEGLSHALVEAIALGTPVVATKVGGNPELIQDGVTGLLVPPNDDNALYAALKRVETDRVGAQARAQAARATLKQFSIDTTITELAKLLTTVCES
jgi:glycosyltransferase involved in cell wall biosynthesis